MCNLVHVLRWPSYFDYFQAEELDEQNVQQTPPGFHVITLPFADDIRKTPFDKEAPRGTVD